MMHSVMIHLDEDDKIVGERGNSTTSNYGTVNIGEDVTIFPRSKAGCRALIAAIEEAEKHFDHARPLGVRDTGSDGMEETRAAQSALRDARDAHDEEGIGNG
jgi:hypothetical protein